MSGRAWKFGDGVDTDVLARVDDAMQTFARLGAIVHAAQRRQKAVVKTLHPHRQARAAGLTVIEDRCVKIEHARLFGGLNWAGVNTRVISAKRPHVLPY